MSRSAKAISGANRRAQRSSRPDDLQPLDVEDLVSQDDDAAVPEDVHRAVGHVGPVPSGAVVVVAKGRDGCEASVWHVAIDRGQVVVDIAVPRHQVAGNDDEVGFERAYPAKHVAHVVVADQGTDVQVAEVNEMTADQPIGQPADRQPPPHDLQPSRFDAPRVIANTRRHSRTCAGGAE